MGSKFRFRLETSTNGYKFIKGSAGQTIDWYMARRCGPVSNREQTWVGEQTASIGNNGNVQHMNNIQWVRMENKVGRRWGQGKGSVIAGFEP